MDKRKINKSINHIIKNGILTANKCIGIIDVENLPDKEIIKLFEYHNNIKLYKTKINEIAKEILSNVEKDNLSYDIDFIKRALNLMINLNPTKRAIFYAIYDELLLLYDGNYIIIMVPYYK